MGGKHRKIGIRENSVNQLKLAIDLIEENNLQVAIVLIKTTITHMEIYPHHCEFADGCREDWEGKLSMKVKEEMSH